MRMEPRPRPMTRSRRPRTVVGAHADRVPVSSTKSMHGHLLGAAGAVEFIATLLAFEAGTAPPTQHLHGPDPECDLDYVPNRARSGLRIDAAMSNSFAFSGTNKDAPSKSRQTLFGCPPMEVVVGWNPPGLTNTRPRRTHSNPFEKIRFSTSTSTATNTSVALLESAGTRSEAAESKTMKLPSALMPV